MYKLYDSNMNQIPFPEGVVPLDFLVGSISKERDTEVIPGRSGVMNYGFRYDSRPVTLNLLAIANDRTDYVLLRNEIYALFDTHDEFYLVDDLVPSRRLKVAVDESYIPDKFNHVESEVTINCRTLDSVFWESTYTTLELHDSGYSATAEKYGLVDNIDDEKVQYRYQSAPFNQNLMDAPYDYRNPKGVNYETIHSGLPEGRYTISFDYEIHEVGRELTGFRLYAGEAIDIIPRTSKNADYTKLTFNINSETANKSIYLYAGTAAGYSTENDASFKRIKIESGDQATPFSMPTTKFTVYNAGNVTVEPESMYLRISLSSMRTYDNDLTIKNLTTGESHVFENGISGGTTYVIEGVSIFQNQANRFRDTNKRFISLLPGENEFEVTGATYGEIRFDFKYLYK